MSFHPKAFILIILAMLSVAAFAQNPGTSPAAPSAINNADADPGFLHLLLVRVHPYLITRTTTQDCLVVEGNGRFHRESVEQAEEGTTTKAFEGTIKPEELSQLANILGSDQFRSTHFDAMRQRYRFRDRKFWVDVWRKDGQQSLHFPDEEIANSYGERLKALQQWWKAVEREKATATKDVTGCKLIPREAPKPETASVTAVTPTPDNTGLGATAAPGRFGEMRLWQAAEYAYSGVSKENCMVIERDGSFQREQTEQGLNGTRSKVFAGKLSLAEVNALAQIVGTQEFRSIVHLMPPERLVLRLSDPAMAFNVLWSNGPEQVYFPDSLSRKPYKDTVGALMKWWNQADKEGTPIDQMEANSCRPHADRLDDLFPAATLASEKTVAPDVSVQPSADLAFTQFRVTRVRGFSWFGSIFWGWKGSERITDCMKVNGDGQVHAEHRLVFHGENNTKIFEGKLSPPDLLALETIMSPHAMRDVHAAERLTAAERSRSLDFETLSFEMLRSPTKHKRGMFRNPAEWQPHEALLAPLVQWWQNVTPKIPQVKNVTPTECRLNSTPGDESTGALPETKHAIVPGGSQPRQSGETSSTSSGR